MTKSVYVFNEIEKVSIIICGNIYCVFVYFINFIVFYTINLVDKHFSKFLCELS